MASTYQKMVKKPLMKIISRHWSLGLRRFLVHSTVNPIVFSMRNWC